MSSRQKSRLEMQSKSQKAEPAVEKPQTADERDIKLDREEAAAAAPSNYSVAGEEDPGVGLEFLVRDDK